jgi:hypothetical protein
MSHINFLYEPAFSDDIKESNFSYHIQLPDNRMVSFLSIKFHQNLSRGSGNETCEQTSPLCINIKHLWQTMMKIIFTHTYTIH